MPKLPDDWQPSNKDREYGRMLLFTDREIDGMAEDMRLWAGANANRQIARKSNWSMAFKGWMRREATRGQNGRRFQNGRLSVSRAAERIVDTIADGGQFTLPARPSLFGGESTPDLFLLPKGRDPQS